MNAIKEAEQIDKFQGSCKNNFLNNLARKDFHYITSYNSYYTNIRDFTQKHPIFDSIEIVQLNHTAENGFPHTRPKNVICIPSNARFPSLEKTLFHEAVHIHQRNNKEAWDRFADKDSVIADNFKTYVTSGSQSLDQISKKFKVPHDVIEDLNPDLPEHSYLASNTVVQLPFRDDHSQSF